MHQNCCCHQNRGRPGVTGWGPGTFGVVYKARLDGLHDVAVKVMQPELVEQEHLQDFCNEVSARPHAA